MRSSIFLIFLHVFAIIWGIHVGASVTARPVDFLYPMTAGVVIVWACAADARARRHPLLSIVTFLMFLAWPVAGPLYLIWSRGWRGAIWAVLWIFTLFLCYFIPAAFVFMQRTRAI